MRECHSSIVLFVPVPEAEIQDSLIPQKNLRSYKRISTLPGDESEWILERVRTRREAFGNLLIGVISVFLCRSPVFFIP